jgi:hypothetical protein
MITGSGWCWSGDTGRNPTGLRLLSYREKTKDWLTIVEPGQFGEEKFPRGRGVAVSSLFLNW